MHINIYKWTIFGIGSATILIDELMLDENDDSEQVLLIILLKLELSGFRK